MRANAQRVSSDFTEQRNWQNLIKNRTCPSYWNSLHFIYVTYSRSSSKIGRRQI